MNPQKTNNSASRFKVFHELMARKVRRILLVSTSYEAWIMEEDCRLSEQIVHEYRGLNLSRPPRLSWVSSRSEALRQIDRAHFDLVITISRTIDSEVYRTGDEIKNIRPDMPVVILTHQEVLPEACVKFENTSSSVDQVFFWSGDAGILLAIIKCIEDRMNVLKDTQRAGIRVIIFVEDSPFYRSSILPVLYRELVIETQSVIDDSLNEEHRILSMRARPKVLLASSYEQAMKLYEQFKPYVLGVISDVSFPLKGAINSEAGLKLLRYIKQDRFDIPLLLASSEPHNARPASKIPAAFIDKNSRALNEKISTFFLEYLGFGDFIFKLPDGSEIDRAFDLHTLENKLRDIPDESFVFHWQRNDFSRWLFSLAEVELASRVRPLRDTDFDSVDAYRKQLIKMIRRQRKDRLKGVIVDYDKDKFDPDAGFLKIGKGSLGGKARGQAFISTVLHRSTKLMQSFGTVDILVPQTLVVTTDNFDNFIRMNHLGKLFLEDLPDETIAQRFMRADFPEKLRAQLTSYLEVVHYPIAVRSSSLFEDAQFKPYAGLYNTFFIANDHSNIDCRLKQLINAIKMVYASTYFKAPKAFTAMVGNRVESERMAVIIQQVVGSRYGSFFYPAISGVAQSKNYYPFSKMKPEDGIVNIALGLGKSVMEGEWSFRFSPRFPEASPQRSSVEDILGYSQQSFYALQMKGSDCHIGINESVNLEKRLVSEAAGDYPVRLLASTYFPEDNRIRDTFSPSGYPVISFASMLKYRRFPLPEIVTALLESGSQELGCPVEMEFAFDVSPEKDVKAKFAVLQIRPMSAREEMLDVEISKTDKRQAFCISHMTLGNTTNREMKDIVYVKPDSFDPAQTVEIAKQIAGINATLMKAGRKYLLIGPGRWGSADHWLGIPVTWADICGVGAIVETVHPMINAEPSQGSHFFHNIVALGITYLNVKDKRDDLMDFVQLASFNTIQETDWVVHASVPRALSLKADGSRGIGVIADNSPAGSITGNPERAC